MTLESVAASNTCVYIGGGFSQDYLYMLEQDPEQLLKNKGTGTSAAMLSNRVSWFYDLKGPSVTIDTACSSSLVALHQACQSIRAGESEQVCYCQSCMLILFSDSFLGCGLWCGHYSISEP